MSKKIVFISTHNLATNPRLVKEIELALQQNYRVEVVCYIFRNWSYEINKQMLRGLEERGVQFHCIEAGRENISDWFISVLKEKTFRLLSKVLPVTPSALANAASRRNNGLMKALKKITVADWVIGHNPGALWATLSAGKKLNCKAGFDVEDYHPGEGHNVHVQKLTKKFMQLVLPKMNYVSFAAPLIMDEVKKDIACDHHNWFIVLNYFPAKEFALPESNLSGPLKLVWFSQNINSGRGLELVLPSVQSNSGKLELHLYGNVNDNFKKGYLDGMNNIFLHGGVSQIQLHRELANFDIGLALDIPTDKNRELAITNKLLTYFQAGLYVIASDIKSQKSFMASFPEMGICFDYERNDFEEIIKNILNKAEAIRESRQERFEKFRNNNWENESKKLIGIWGTICLTTK